MSASAIIEITATQVVICAWCEGKEVAEREVRRVYPDKAITHTICALCRARYIAGLRQHTGESDGNTLGSP